MKVIKTAYLLIRTLITILASYLNPSKRPKVTQFQSKPVKILLFGYMGLGDALMFQPSLRAIIDAFPLGTIDLIVSPESQSRAMLERIMSMEGKSFRNVFEAAYKSLSIKDLRELNRKLKAAKYDIVICTYMSPSPYFTPAIASAAIRVGHKLPWDKWYKPRPNRLYNVSVTLAQDHEHETSRHLRLIRELLESDVPYQKPKIELLKAEREFANAFWIKHGLVGRTVIGTHFGASKAQHWKKWDDDRFSEVLREISEKYNPVFLHFGVANESEQIDEASKFVKSSSINLAGKLSIFEVAALLTNCNSMLANDSGLGHIAMAIGTRTIRVFGMSDYWGYRSLSSEHIDIFKGISCSPCLQLGYLKPYNVHNCGHKNCMKLITVAEVVGAMSEAGLMG